MSRNCDIYFLTHHSDKVTLKKNQKDIILNYKDKNINIDINTFISTLNKEIKKVKQLDKFKHTSQPKKWQKGPKRDKITEKGREYVFACAMRMRGRTK